jgi:hypothetical protein
VRGCFLLFTSPQPQRWAGSRPGPRPGLAHGQVEQLGAAPRPGPRRGLAHDQMERLGSVAGQRSLLGVQPPSLFRMHAPASARATARAPPPPTGPGRVGGYIPLKEPATQTADGPARVFRPIPEPFFPHAHMIDASSLDRQVTATSHGEPGGGLGWPAVAAGGGRPRIGRRRPAGASWTILGALCLPICAVGLSSYIEGIARICAVGRSSYIEGPVFAEPRKGR